MVGAEKKGQCYTDVSGEEQTMSGRLPREFIDQLLSRIDVVEVVDRCVPLKKAGKDFKACCPFHDEKTPSFTIIALAVGRVGPPLHS